MPWTRLSTLRQTLTRRWWVETLLLTVAVAVIYHVSMQQNLGAEQGLSPIWVKPGFSVAALLLLGLNRWPGIWVGTAVMMVAGPHLGYPTNDYSDVTLLWATLYKTTLDVALALLGASLIQRLCDGRNPLYRLQDTAVLALVLGVVLPGLSTLVSLPVMLQSNLVSGSLSNERIAVWWLSELVGAWVLAPMMLAWSDPREVRLLRRRWLHALLVMGMLLAVGVLSFSAATREILSEGVLAALWLPMLAWAALALGQAGATFAAFLATGLALGGAVVGGVPFRVDRIFGGDDASLRMSELTLQLINVQVFVASMAITAVSIGAVAAERRRFQEALASHRDRLRNMARELVGSEHRRQHDLAQQLHDGLGQDLAMAKLRLGEIEQHQAEDVPKALRETMQFIERAVAVTRGITFELAPPSLGSLGLPAALRSLGDTVEQRDGVIFEYAQEGPDQRLPQELETMLYRCARELITNVVKHADASHVGIDLHLRRQRVTMIVWDDGRGLDRRLFDRLGNGDGRGFGLYSLRETVESLGGQMTLQPRDPGSSIRVEVPLPIAAHDRRRGEPDEEPLP